MPLYQIHFISLSVPGTYPITDYIWDTGDGGRGTGPDFIYTYAEAGTYTATLTTVDEAGNISSVSQTIDIIYS